MRNAVKAVMDDNSNKVKIDTAFAIKDDYYSFMKKEAQNSYVAETNTVLKIYLDLYMSSYYGERQCSVPAFAFVQD